MERILEIELTKLEKERAKECRREFGCRGHLYCVTESSLGIGYEIVWSANRLSAWAGFDQKTMRFITDTGAMLEKI